MALKQRNFNGVWATGESNFQWNASDGWNNSMAQAPLGETNLKSLLQWDDKKLQVSSHQEKQIKGEVKCGGKEFWGTRSHGRKELKGIVCRGRNWFQKDSWLWERRGWVGGTKRAGKKEREKRVRPGRQECKRDSRPLEKKIEKWVGHGKNEFKDQ